MKYWRGYLVAAVLAAITGALVAFAKAHSALVDMVYPYMSKTIVSTLADWSSGVSFCLWNVLVLALVVGLLVSVILMFILRWNSIQWLGWVLSVVSLLSLFSTLIFGLNKYTGPLADDIRLEMTEYTVTELNEATVYFRDQAAALGEKIKRDDDGNPKYPGFEKLAKMAGDGFEVLTYEEAMSVFSGSTAPVKKQSLAGSTLSKTLALTGECVADPHTEDVVLPFVMCMEMARRMSIYHEEDAKFAAFLACKANPDVRFQYTAYTMAYALCNNALKQIPTSTAKACVKEIEANTSKALKNDAALCEEDFGGIFNGSKETDVADMLTSWYVQNFITPLYEEEELPFNPLDPNQVDIEYEAPTPTPLPEKKEE